MREELKGERKMNITGTITNVGQASEPTGNYQVRYQDIVITDPNGREYVGRIGSKAGYQVNTPISVTVEVKQGDSGEYNYFRKYNPEYADRTAPQRSAQAPSPAPQSPKPDWDAIAEGKVRTHLVGDAIASGQIKIKGITDLTYWVGYCMTGRAPLPPSKIPDPHPDIQEQADDIPY